MLRLWQLISPALPVGAYAYSGGLETAIHRGWVHDDGSLIDWIDGQLNNGIGSLDLPVLKRLQAGWQCHDRASVDDWTARLLASRETAELRAEDIHIGRALMRLIADLDVQEARRFDRDTHVTWATGFALAAARWSIPVRATALGYAWAWLENQIAAAVKLIPLGQTVGQRALMDLSARIPPAVDRAAQLGDDAIGATTPGISLASGWHETQYSRLFRS
jgi:urease accessory protein